MSSLSSRQRKTLRGLAHPLEPVVHIGKQGLTEPALAAVDAALDTHELIKVKLLAERGEREEMAGALGERLGCETVGLIGRVAIFYRRHPEPEKRKIRLPEEG
jgi:RNA-binding protein